VKRCEFPEGIRVAALKIGTQRYEEE